MTRLCCCGDDDYDAGRLLLVYRSGDDADDDCER